MSDSDIMFYYRMIAHMPSLSLSTDCLELTTQYFTRSDWYVGVKHSTETRKSLTNEPIDVSCEFHAAYSLLNESESIWAIIRSS